MKSRDLSIFDFFENLQVEYICAEIRYKIFQKHYSSYWKKVMSGKEEKIRNIAEKNRLASIFSNKQEYNRIYSKIVPEWGEPVFIYRNKEQKMKLEKWDKLFFFNKNTEVKLMNEDNSISIGEILDNSMCLNEFPVLLVKKKGQEKSYLTPIKRVQRIL